MKRAASLAATALTAAVLSGVAVAGPVLAAPVATASASSMAPGGYVRISGSGWAPVGGVVSVGICGNQALDGSVDCDNAATATSAIRPGGVFTAGLLVEPPPVPCPCVIRVVSAQGSDPALIPLAIPGARVAPPVKHTLTSRGAKLTAVKLTGSNSWRSWFGFPVTRKLVFTVTNVGNVTVHQPEVDVTVGRGADPSGFVPPPSIDSLAPGQSTTLIVPIHFPTLAFGSYTVAIRVDPLGVVAIAHVKNRIIPWGLIAALVLVVQLLLLWGRNRVRRRVLGRDEECDTSGPPPVLTGVSN